MLTVKTRKIDGESWPSKLLLQPPAGERRTLRYFSHDRSRAEGRQPEGLRRSRRSESRSPRGGLRRSSWRAARQPESTSLVAPGVAHTHKRTGRIGEEDLPSTRARET